MSLKEVFITKSDGTEQGRWPIDNDQIERAAYLTIEDHNRDNPDDIWTVGITQDKILVEEK